MIGMADSHSQGISGIATRCPAETEQGSHHTLHLLFLCMTVSGYRLLDHPRRVIMNRQSLFHGRSHCRASSLAQLKGRADIMGGKQILHRCDLRLMLLHNLRESFKNDQQAAGKIFFRTRADGTAGDKAEARPMFVDNTVAGDPGAGINADDPYRSGIDNEAGIRL